MNKRNQTLNKCGKNFSSKRKFNSKDQISLGIDLKSKRLL